MKVIGLDNGVTGTIGCASIPFFAEVPTIKVQNYTKKKDNISRLNVAAFKIMLEDIVGETPRHEVRVIIERPLVNPQMYKATCSALRCFEAELTIIEALELPYQFADSKEWQRCILPKGLKGSAELKKASHDVGVRLFPSLKTLIDKHKDADSLLMSLVFSKNT